MSPRFGSFHQCPPDPLSTVARVDDDVSGCYPLRAKHAGGGWSILDTDLHHPDHGGI